MKEARLDKETLQEKYEDSLFAVLMDEFSEAEGQRLIEENERLINDKHFALPKEFEALCKETINHSITAKERKERSRKTLKILSRVAVVVAMCGVSFVVLYSSVSAFRISVWKLFQVSDNASTSIGINVTGEQTINENNITIPIGSYLPTWLPDGYELTSYTTDEKTTTAYFTNSENNTILYFEQGNNQVLDINTDGASNIENIEINGFEGLLVVRNDTVSVSWADISRNVIVRIKASGLDKETVVEIAKSVRKNE
ncbi:MAG: DUF4367 domain-containing protein [Oscillospiraceae bacterium]|nr:DUF4367 domain-containing protein [Oscillospiraceae bacterium]